MCEDRITTCVYWVPSVAAKEPAAVPHKLPRIHHPDLDHGDRQMCCIATQTVEE
jgi:hypothetical protein